jgi:chemotaxis protein methyltransferase CheR
MQDRACISFLQHYLPGLGYRWKGFRKVRKQVCKRIHKRIRELDLADILAYGEYLENHGHERKVLDALCNITISRFYRDKRIFDNMARDVLPSLAEKARQNRQEQIRCWSAGSASGEEPYTLAIIWNMAVWPGPGSDLSLRITATDRDAHLIERAEKGIYPEGTLKELPREWRKQAFEQACKRAFEQPSERAFERAVERTSEEDPEQASEHKENEYRIKDEYRQDIHFLLQDIRSDLPEGTFDIILCRNLVFTYFREDLQRKVLQRILTRLNPGGYLVIGIHESLPEGQEDLVLAEKCLYRKRGKGEL